jgi:excisionase family DNA binding protein
MADKLVSVEEAGRALGVSRSTVWRMIKRGELVSVRRGGRRLVRAAGLRSRARRAVADEIPPFTLDHPMWRLVGAGRSGGQRPGARDKHAILDE